MAPRQGFVDCRRELDYSSHPTELGHWNASLQCGVRRGGANCLERWKVEHGTKLDEGAGPNQNRYCFAAARPMSAPGPTGERQEHLDAIVFFAGAGQRIFLFRDLDILTIKWATGDFTQLMFLKKEKGPNLKAVR